MFKLGGNQGETQTEAEVRVKKKVKKAVNRNGKKSEKFTIIAMPWCV